MIRKLVAAFVTVLFAASIHATAFADEFIPVDGDKNRDYFKAGDILRMTGMAVGPQNWDKNDSFYKTFARQAARMDALRSLAEAIGGVSLDSTTHVNADGKVDVDYLKSTLPQDGKAFKLLEKNARVVDVKFLDGGGCQVTMEVVFPTDWKD